MHTSAICLPDASPPDAEFAPDGAGGMAGLPLRSARGVAAVAAPELGL